MHACMRVPPPEGKCVGEGVGEGNRPWGGVQIEALLVREGAGHRQEQGLG